MTKQLAMLSAVLMIALGSSSVSAEPALIITDQGCGLLDGNGSGVAATSDHQVVTSNDRGNLTLKCSVKGVANDTGKAVHFDFDSTGILCGTFFGATDNWKETVSNSGNATLTCHLP